MPDVPLCAGNPWECDCTDTAHKHTPSSINGNGRTYDANGNLTGRSGLSLKYDAESRLVKVGNAAGYVARFIYDGDGKRVKRVDNLGTVIYVGPHYERNVGTGVDTNDTVTKMYWAQLGSHPSAHRRAEGTECHRHGQLGSTKKLSSDSNAFKYYPYGATFQEPAGPPTDNLYTGQKRDASTGLYYYGARYYDCAIGRFVQPDSVIPSAGSPQDLNRYTYARNNPLAYTDPTGHWAWIVAGAAIGGLMAYRAQVAQNISQEGLTVQAFAQNIDVRQVAAGAVAGGVGAATFGGSLWAMGAMTGVKVTGASLTTAVASGASGVPSGMLAQIGGNLVGGSDWDEGAFDPRAVASNAIMAGIVPAGQLSAGRISPFVKARISRSMNGAIQELVQHEEFLADSALGKGNRIHDRTAQLMGNENIPGLGINELIGQPPGKGNYGYPDYYFHPGNKIWDIKPRRDPFRKAGLYRRLTGADVEAIRYDKQW